MNESRGGRVALSLLSQWVIVLGNEVESHWWLRTQATWSSLWDSLRSWILSCLASVSAKRCQFSFILHVFPWFWNSPWHIQAVTAKEPCCPEESSFQFSISKFAMSSTREDNQGLCARATMNYIYASCVLPMFYQCFTGEHHRLSLQRSVRRPQSITRSSRSPATNLRSNLRGDHWNSCHSCQHRSLKVNVNILTPKLQLLVHRITADRDFLVFLGCLQPKPTHLDPLIQHSWVMWKVSSSELPLWHPFSPRLQAVTSDR